MLCDRRVVTSHARPFRCEKQLADDQAVMFHAARTKHEAFSESTEAVKPLTEEEKKERLAALQKKLKEARAKKEDEERKETLEKVDIYLIDLSNVIYSKFLHCLELL